MKREEMLDRLKYLKSRCDSLASKGLTGWKVEAEALDMAIAALTPSPEGQEDAECATAAQFSGKNSDLCFALKTDGGTYYCGLNKWDEQVRKAQLFRSEKWAKEASDAQEKKNGIVSHVVRVFIAEQ